MGSIDDLFAENGLGDLLMDYSPSPTPEVDHDRIAGEKMLERVRTQLASAAWRIQCTASDDGWALSLSGDKTPNIEEVDIRVWLLSVSRERAVGGHSVGPSQAIKLGTFATEEVTSLLGFHLKAGAQEMSFAVEAKVSGMPPDRDSAIDRLIIRNRDGFVRYLLLLLGSLVEESEMGGHGTGAWSGMTSGVGHAPPLFDMLASAYAKDPERVVPIARLIRRLSEGDHRSVIPDDFLRIWSVFEQALIKDGIHVDAL